MGEFTFEIKFDVELFFMNVRPKRPFMESIRLQINGGDDGPGRWLCLGRPDGDLLRLQAGTAKFEGDFQNTCLLTRDASRDLIASLVNFTYDVISGPIIVAQSYLATLPQSFGMGTWTTLKHEYGHGDDAVEFTDDSGNKVLDRFGNMMYRPQKLDPKEILRLAVARRRLEEDEGASPEADLNFLNFRQKACWDAQRLKGDFQREFQDLRPS